MKSFVEVFFDLNEIFISSKNNYLPFWPEKKWSFPAILKFQLPL